MVNNIKNKYKTIAFTALFALSFSTLPTYSKSLDSKTKKNLAIAGFATSAITGAAATGLAIHTYYKISQLKQKLKNRVITEEHYQKEFSKITTRYKIAAILGGVALVGGITSGATLKGLYKKSIQRYWGKSVESSESVVIVPNQKKHVSKSNDDRTKNKNSKEKQVEIPDGPITTSAPETVSISQDLSEGESEGEEDSENEEDYEEPVDSDEEEIDDASDGIPPLEAVPEIDDLVVHYEEDEMLGEDENENEPEESLAAFPAMHVTNQDDTDTVGLYDQFPYSTTACSNMYGRGLPIQSTTRTTIEPSEIEEEYWGELEIEESTHTNPNHMKHSRFGLLVAADSRSAQASPGRLTSNGYLTSIFPTIYCGGHYERVSATKFKKQRNIAKNHPAKIIALLERNLPDLEKVSNRYRNTQSRDAINFALKQYRRLLAETLNQDKDKENLEERLNFITDANSIVIKEALAGKKSPLNLIDRKLSCFRSFL